MSEAIIVKASGKEIFTSGVAFTFEKNGSIELTLPAANGNDLVFRFLFEDNDNGVQSVIPEATDSNLTLKCVNFNNELGTGLKRAIEVGDYEGRKLYLTFMVYGTAEQKKLEYCFFIGGLKQ